MAYYRTAQHCTIRQPLDTAIYNYCDQVVNKEWEMESADQSDHPSAIPSLRQMLLTIEPQNKLEEGIYSVIDEDLSSISDLRRDRLSHNHSQIPSLVWLVLEAGSIMLIIFSYFLSVPSLKLKRIYLSFLTGCISMCMFLVYTLDRPFNGNMQVSKAPYANILSALKQHSIISYHKKISMTLIQLKTVTGSMTSSAQAFLSYLDDTLTNYNILTPARTLCFLAQVGHESGGLFYTEELASGTAYEGRLSLGNTQPGDGVKFKGRGLIQITGRANYQALSAALGADFIADPTLLGGKNVNACNADQLKYAALSAGWFWNRSNLNAFADQINLKQPIYEGSNLDNFKEITRRINGGFNGLPDRLHRYQLGASLFIIQPTTLNTTTS